VWDWMGGCYLFFIHLVLWFFVGVAFFLFLCGFYGF